MSVDILVRRVFVTSPRSRDRSYHIDRARRNIQALLALSQQPSASEIPLLGPHGPSMNRNADCQSLPEEASR